MRAVSTFGGPQVLLPTSDIDRWIDELGDDTPTPDTGLYGLTCSDTEYCGVISPWGKPILVFGDIPADIHWFPHLHDGVFARWIAGDGYDSFADFVAQESDKGDWPDSVQLSVIDANMTLMDSCTYPADDRFRLRLALPIGTHTIHSRYVANDANIAVLHRIENGG